MNRKALILGFCLVALWTGAGYSQANGVAEDARIIYLKAGDVWSKTGAGSDEQQMTDRPELGFETLKVSPDGSQFALYSPVKQAWYYFDEAGEETHITPVLPTAWQREETGSAAAAQSFIMRSAGGDAGAKVVDTTLIENSSWGQVKAQFGK